MSAPHHPPVLAVVAGGEPDRRSQSEAVPRQPVLKLAQNDCELVMRNRPQVIEAANDTGLCAVTLPEPSILYRGAGLKSDHPPEPLRSVGHGQSSGGDRSSFQPTARGGPRNRAGRVSDDLTTAQAGGLIAAMAFAERIGLPLSRFTTVHWESAGVGDEVRATGRFLKTLGEAARRRGYPFAYFWTRENGPGKGGHLHLLWHGPADWPDLERCLRKAMKAAGVTRRVARVRRTYSVGRSLRAAMVDNPAFLTNLAAVQGYIIKGASEAARMTLKLERAGAGGRVIGKRCGVSENLQPAARRAWEERKLPPPAKGKPPPD